MEWEADLPEGSRQEVVLEGPDGRTTICTTEMPACFAPPELRADTDYRWWVRAITPKGIVRSDSFVASTPSLGAALDVERPAKLPHTGKFPWTASGSDAAFAAAIFRPTDGGPPTVCIGNGCELAERLRASTTYDISLRVYGETGMYLEEVLEDLAVNQPPSSSRPIFPQIGAEVPIGETRLQWSASEELEGEPVAYRVLWTRHGDGTWHEAAPGSATMASIATEASETYAWRIESSDAAGNAVLSPIFLFHTPDAPPAAILVADDLRVPPSGTKTFHWVGSASSQSVEFRELDSTSEWHFACSGTNTCTTQLDGRPGVTYEWRVKNDDAYYGTTYSASGTFETVPLVVLLHGLWSSGDAWATGAQALQSSGFHVLDLDPVTPQADALSYQPSNSEEGIRATALDVVAPQINAALGASGYPDDAPVIIVGHSMGGLIGRVLANDGAITHDVERLITLGTPHQGSGWADELLQFGVKKGASKAVGALLATSGYAWLASMVVGVAIEAAISPWNTALDDLAPNSAFIAQLNAEPATVPVWAVAGTEDLIVSVQSAIAAGDKTRLVALGHTQMTGKLCGIVGSECKIDSDAIDVVDEWLRLGASQ